MSLMSEGYKIKKTASEHGDRGERFSAMPGQE
jgi:hypothetical protein